MVKCARLAAALLIFAVAAAAPVHTLGTNFVVEQTLQNPGQGTAVGRHLAYVSSLGIIVSNATTVDGWYASYRDNSAGVVALSYIHDGYPTCYVAKFPPNTTPLPSVDPFEYLSPVAYASLRGRVVQRYEAPNALRNTRYNVWGFVDNVTGDPVLLNGGFQAMSAEWTSIQRDAFPPGATPQNTPALALPAMCVKPNGTIGFSEASTAAKTMEDVSGLGVHATTAAAVRAVDARASSVTVSAAVVSSFRDGVDNSVYAGPVQNQGYCGACWAFSTSMASLVVLNKRFNATLSKTTSDVFSPQYLIDCVVGSDPAAMAGYRTFTKGCSGGNPHVSLQHIAKHGIPRLIDYPFVAVNGKQCKTSAPRSRPLSGVDLITPLNISAIQSAIRRNGAVVALISVPPTFLYYGGFAAPGGVYDDPNCRPGLQHAVVLTGFGVTAAGVPYWDLLNSFGPGWGRAGYMRIKAGVNMCGVELLVSAPF